MTDLELQSHRADLHRHTGWPAWDILNDLATESEAANTLGQITRWTGGFAGHWCYRGHADECWLLVSSLHRERKQITLAVGDGIHTTHPPFDARAHEASELADFQISEPTTNAPSDQLATMQHYGASTTSLDFSWSHHVAIWFALKDSMSGKHNDGSRKSSALWAIDLDWLAKAGQAMIDNGDPHVIAIQDVKYPNPRMVAQKGVLLVNRSTERTFTESLLGMLVKSPIAAERQVVSKLVVRRDRLIEMLQDLEEMGIYHTSMLRPNTAVRRNAESARDRMQERTANEREQFRESLRRRMESRTPRE